MSAPLPDHTQKIKSRLDLLERDRGAMLKFWEAVVGQAGSQMFPLDLPVAAMLMDSPSWEEPDHHCLMISTRAGARRKFAPKLSIFCSGLVSLRFNA